MKIYKSKRVMAALLLGGSLGWATAASATASIQSVNGSLPAGATMDDLDWLVPGPVGGDPNISAGGTNGATGLFVSFSDDGGAITGSKSGVYLAPEITAGNGGGFGLPIGTDTTVYATAGGKTGSSATFLFPSSENTFGFLWGSVETFNILTFKNGGTDIGTITGADLLAHDGVTAGSSYYVIIGTNQPFDRVIATSSDYTFEIDNVGFANVTTAPEPLTLSLFGAGLAGLGFARRRKA